MSRAPVDLDRLNAAERQVLRLLAEGHTAKSIANAIASTPAAVNERLREARRKTGIGSSRELARLLRTQENRHDQMGMGKAASSGTLVPLPDVEPWRPEMGVIAMIGLFVVAAAGAAALLAHQPPTAHDQSSSATNDPLFATIFAEQDPTKLFTSPPKTKQDFDREVAGEGFRALLRQLHAKVHSEPRDAAWASQTETALHVAFGSIPKVAVKGTELRVLCGSTLCEIAGTLDAPTRTKAGIDKFNHATMSRLNPKALETDTDKLRLKSMAASIGTMTGNRMSYIFYYSRKS